MQQSSGFGLGSVLLFGILAAVVFSIFSSGDGDFGGDVGKWTELAFSDGHLRRIVLVNNASAQANPTQ